jgi:hypothetical protein
MCKDYISEKLYHLFNDDTDFVPVFRGAPNVKAMFPANTYILTVDYNVIFDWNNTIHWLAGKYNLYQFKVILVIHIVDWTLAEVYQVVFSS